MFFSLTSGGTLKAPGEKFRIAFTPAATTMLTTAWAPAAGHGDHRDADVLTLHDLLEVPDVVDEHPAARTASDLVPQRVEQRHDLEPIIAEPGIVGEREAEVAGAHDPDPDAAVEAENLAQVTAQLLDVVADAADAELAEVGQVLPDLRGVQVELLGQRLRRDRADPGRVQRAEAAQIDGEAIGRQLRNGFGQCAHAGCRHDLVLPVHKQNSAKAQAQGSRLEGSPSGWWLRMALEGLGLMAQAG